MRWGCDLGLHSAVCGAALGVRFRGVLRGAVGV
jgi:hypothetical protein